MAALSNKQGEGQCKATEEDGDQRTSGKETRRKRCGNVKKCFRSVLLSRT